MLGICVVYLVPEGESNLLLKLHLHQIASTTEGRYRVYGVALRAAEDLTRKLRDSGVNLPGIPEYVSGTYRAGTEVASEHSYYLDQLTDHAFRDGCTHVATFDMDSWPIQNGWNSYYSRFLTLDVPVVALQRAELEDEFPNPAFTLMNAGFWRTGKTSFSFGNPRFIYNKGVLSRFHSGAGILAELKMGKRKFLPLIRNNRWNPHPVMCGIYDHRIFHFGAGSRQPSFVTDRKEFQMIDTDISRSYVKAVNEAKRDFFLAALENSGAEFIRQLTYGEFVNQVPAKDPSPPG